MDASRSALSIGGSVAALVAKLKALGNESDANAVQRQFMMGVYNSDPSKAKLERARETFAAIFNASALTFWLQNNFHEPHNDLA